MLEYLFTCFDRPRRHKVPCYYLLHLIHVNEYCLSQPEKIQCISNLKHRLVAQLTVLI